MEEYIVGKIRRGETLYYTGTVWTNDRNNAKKYTYDEAGEVADKVGGFIEKL